MWLVLLRKKWFKREGMTDRISVIVTTYERAVRATCGWLVEATRERPWQELMPRMAQYMQDSFDYAAEDELVRSLATGD